MTILDRIKELSKSRDKTVKEVAIELGLGENYLYSLKNKIPNGQTLQKLADYFHVSVDYLLGREDIEKIKEPVDLKDIVSDHVNFEDVNWDEWLSFGGKPLTEKDKMLLFATFYNRDEK